jgi:hypothetical protein
LEVYLNQYHAFSCCRKSSFCSRKEIPVSTTVTTRVILALTFLLLPSEAQQTAKTPRVGFLAPQGRSLPLFDAFRQSLDDLGYVDGHNITP